MFQIHSNKIYIYIYNYIYILARLRNYRDFKMQPIEQAFKEYITSEGSDQLAPPQSDPKLRLITLKNLWVKDYTKCVIRGMHGLL